jgi:hypothetical protein
MEIKSAANSRACRDRLIADERDFAVRHNQSGISLVEVMVASGVGIVIMLAVSSMMNHQAKIARQIAAKSEATHVGSLLKLMMSSPEGCAKALRMNVEGVTYNLPRSDLPFPGASVNRDFTHAINTIRIGETTVSVDQNYAGLTFIGAQLANFSHLSGMDFLTNFRASFQIDASSSSGMSSIPMTPMAPLRVRFAEIPNDTTSLRMISCQISNVVEPQPTCVALGGRWLSGSNMPFPRCNMGADLSLAINEAPDGIPTDGSANEFGERVETCFRQRQNSTQISSYQCPALSTGRAGNRCAFVGSQWGIWYYNAQGVRRTTPAGTCERGVKVSLQAPETAMLALGERIGLAGFDGITNPSALSLVEELDLLPAAKRCKNSISSDQYLDCSTDPNRITQGLTGACIYVRGVKGIPTYTTHYNTYNNQLCGSNNPCPGSVSATKYTGWIRVTQNRAVQANASSGLRIQEARGVPCFEVAVQPGVIDNVRPYSDPQSSRPTEEQMTDPSLVQQCIVRGPPSVYETQEQSPPTERENYFRCDNSGVSTDPDNSYEGMVGGPSAQAVPSLTTGTCWYVIDTKVPLNYLQPTPGTNASTVRYTGWVYLRSSIPDNVFTVESTASSPNLNGIKPKPTFDPRINALPCTGGIRAKQP